MIRDGCGLGDTFTEEEVILSTTENESFLILKEVTEFWKPTLTNSAPN